MIAPNTMTFSTIRRARPVDAQQIISGINAICVEGEAFYTTRFVVTPQWEAVLYRPETLSDYLLMVAEWKGQVVGAGRLFPGGKYTLLSHMAELGIFVLRPFRHQGIGTLLLACLMDWAVQQGIEKITLSVFATNQPAMRFFGRHGFIQEGCLRRQIKTGERYIDLLLMGLFLNGLGKS